MGKRTITDPAAGKRTRTITHPSFKSARQVREEAKRGAAEKPEPTSHRSRRMIVGIQPGDLVRVRGDRDHKYVVLSVPDFRGRWQGRNVSTVDLLGPTGPVTVPLRFCTPYVP